MRFIVTGRQSITEASPPYTIVRAKAADTSSAVQAITMLEYAGADFAVGKTFTITLEDDNHAS